MWCILHPKHIRLTDNNSIMLHQHPLAYVPVPRICSIMISSKWIHPQIIFFWGTWGFKPIQLGVCGQPNTINLSFGVGWHGHGMGMVYGSGFTTLLCFQIQILVNGDIIPGWLALSKMGGRVAEDRGSTTAMEKKTHEKLKKNCPGLAWLAMLWYVMCCIWL